MDMSSPRLWLRLAENVVKSWGDYPAEKITRAFQNKALIIDKIIEYEGGNHFEVPHVSAEAREERMPADAVDLTNEI